MRPSPAATSETISPGCNLELDGIQFALALQVWMSYDIGLAMKRNLSPYVVPFLLNAVICFWQLP